MKTLKIAIFLILLSAITSYTNAKSEVILITIDGGIGPATAAYIKSGIEYGEKISAEALIIKLNTPGGLLESTRNIVEYILEAEIPVVVFVAPGGSRAGSAGVFITLSGHIAAMAPGTNIGAAHPVGLGGQSDTTAMFDKITNDAAAFVRTIAQKRNRNEEWAELTVRESISSTENEALEAGAIDLIANNLDSLLIAIDGMTIEVAGAEVTLNTKSAKIIEKEMNWREELLSMLSDPNIAYLFLMLGIYGLLFELYSPGSIFPGVIGAISLMIAAYSLQMMPINYAGLGLIILAFILFIIEIFVASYGLLTIGGILSLLLGSIMLIDSPYEFMEISRSLIVTVTILTAIFFIWLITYGVKAQFRKKYIGSGDTLADEQGVALSNISPDTPGRVRVHGEIWQAESQELISEGDAIRVTKLNGLKVIVKKDIN